MLRKLTVGSCFSGIGGLELGLEWTGGFETKWQIENDPYASAVLAKHWPNVKRYGDVAAVDADKLERADLFCFGSPCQDLSLAGNRKGLAGKKSVLFFEAMRIADRITPDWILFENVVGLLSSRNGEDFATMLGRFTGYKPTVPADGWRKAGICVGPLRTSAWRVLDAQYFGVAQRRRRVFVVSNPRRFAPLAVLFEPESCDWNDPSVKEMGQVGFCISTRDGERQDPSSETLVASTIRVSHGAVGSSKAFGDDNVVADTIGCNPTNGSGIRSNNLVAQTLGATARGNASFVWQDTHIAEAVDQGKGIGDGVSDWTHRSRCLGNAVVPYCTKWLGHRIRKVSRMILNIADAALLEGGKA